MGSCWGEKFGWRQSSCVQGSNSSSFPLNIHFGSTYLTFMPWTLSPLMGSGERSEGSPTAPGSRGQYSCVRPWDDSWAPSSPPCLGWKFEKQQDIVGWSGGSRSASAWRCSGASARAPTALPVDVHLPQEFGVSWKIFSQLAWL